MRASRIAQLILIALLLAARAPGAKPAVSSARLVELFQADGSAVSDYGDVIGRLRRGALTHLTAEGRGTYQIKGVLGGHGTEAVVLDAINPEGKEVALRLAFSPDHIGHQEFQQHYAEGYEKLVDLGVPVPQMYRVGPPGENHGRGPQYIEMELIPDIRFDLNQIGPYTDRTRVDIGGGKEIPGKTVLEQLLAFAGETYRAESIDDFSEDNIVYSPTRGWLLLDWGKKIVAADLSKSQGKSHQLFDFDSWYYGGPEMKALFDRVCAEVIRRRKLALGCPGPLGELAPPAPAGQSK
jgi:hypothetical protein